MEIHKIKELDDTILQKLDTLINTHCQPGKFSLIDIRDKYSKNMELLYLFENDTPIYVLLLDIFVKHKTVYIHDVCVHKSSRGKGLFKKSLVLLKSHYSKLGFKSFTLDASDSTKETGLDQKARIHIFHSAGFTINTETGLFNQSGDYEVIKTIVSLDDGSKVELQSCNGPNYIVRPLESPTKEYTINIKQIEHCYDSDLNQISCPMRLTIPTSGGKRKTHRRTRF
jgi:hypothetical protein